MRFLAASSSSCNAMANLEAISAAALADLEASYSASSASCNARARDSDPSFMMEGGVGGFDDAADAVVAAADDDAAYHSCRRCCYCRGHVVINYTASIIISSSSLGVL